MIERAASGAGLELKAHPHMLRHASGYVGWLGHPSTTSIVNGYPRSLTKTKGESAFPLSKDWRILLARGIPPIQSGRSGTRSRKLRPTRSGSARRLRPN
jgi:hypothetical protein